MIGLARHGLRQRVLDAREIDDALAHDGAADLAHVLAVVDDRLGLGIGRAHELGQASLQRRLDVEQCRRDGEQLVGGRELGRLVDEPLEPRHLGQHARSLLAEAEHAERVRDLGHELDLRPELRDVGFARAHVDVQHVFDAREVLANRRRDRLHERDAGRGEFLARALDLGLAGQRIVERERLADRTHLFARVLHAGDVEEQAVEQVGHGFGVEHADAAVDHALDAPVDLAEQALDRDGQLEAAVAQRLDDAADDPPEAVGVVAIGRALEGERHVLELGEMALRGFAVGAQEAEQRDLECRPDLARELDEILARRGAATADRDLVRRRAIEQQDRGFGEQRTPAHGAQIVEHG